MGLDKAIESGKERREEYRRGKAVCRSCRNHGGCPYCEGNRLNKQRRDEEDAQDQIDEAMGEA